MTSFFDALYSVLGYPFGFVLRFITDYITSNYGVALILFTLFARLLMVPTTITQQKSSVKTMRIQPKIRRINEKYKGDQQKITQETQALYQREGYNPMGAGCVPLLVQLPIIYGLIGVIYHPLKYALLIDSDVLQKLKEAAPEILGEAATKRANYIELNIISDIDKFKDLLSPAIFERIKSFDFTFFGIDLGRVPDAKTPNALWLIPALCFLASLASGIFSMIRSKKQNPTMAKNPSMGCMTFGMPLFSLYLAFQFPVGIGVYWIASNVFAFLTMLVTSFTHSPNKLIAKDMVEETIQRRSREAHIKQLSEMKNKNAD